MPELNNPTALLTLESDGIESRLLLPDGTAVAGVVHAQVDILPGQLPVLKLELIRFNVRIKHDA